MTKPKEKKIKEHKHKWQFIKEIYIEKSGNYGFWFVCECGANKDVERV